MNPRHEKYCQNLILGMSQTDAYLKAGYKDTPHTRNRASKLSTINHIVVRIEELREKTAEKFEITKDKLLAELAKTAISKVEDKVRHSDKLKATEIINKMCGYNEPEKVDLTGKSIEKIGDAIQKIAKSK